MLGTAADFSDWAEGRSEGVARMQTHVMEESFFLLRPQKFLTSVIHFSRGSQGGMKCGCFKGLSFNYTPGRGGLALRALYNSGVPFLRGVCQQRAGMSLKMPSGVVASCDSGTEATRTSALVARGHRESHGEKAGKGPEQEEKPERKSGGGEPRGNEPPGGSGLSRWGLGEVSGAVTSLLDLPDLPAHKRPSLFFFFLKGRRDRYRTSLGEEFLVLRSRTLTLPANSAPFLIVPGKGPVLGVQEERTV